MLTRNIAKIVPFKGIFIQILSGAAGRVIRDHSGELFCLSFKSVHSNLELASAIISAI
jgi:hypothetical protein